MNLKAFISKITSFYKKIKKPWKWGFTILFGLSLTLWIGSIILLKPVKAVIVKRASTLLDRHEVQIGSLSTNFFNALIASDIRISNSDNPEDGNFIVIRKIRIKYKITEIFQEGWTPQKGVKAIEAIDPILYLKRKNNQWNGLRILKPDTKKGDPIYPDFILEDGEIRVEDETKKLDGLRLTDLNGTLTGLPNTPEFKFSCESPNEEKLTLHAHMNPDRVFKISLNSVNFQPGLYFNRYTQPHNLRLEGSLSAEAEMLAKVTEEGLTRPSLNHVSIYSFKGLAQFDQFKSIFDVRGNSIPVEMNGKIHFDEEKIITQFFSIQSEESHLNINAKVTSPTKNPQIISNATGTIQLSEVFPFHEKGTKNPLVKGKAFLKAKMSGPVKDPKLESSIRVTDALFTNHPLAGHLKLIASRSEVKLTELKGTWKQGDFKIYGFFSPQHLNWSANIKKISIQDLLAIRLPHIKEGNASGLASLKLSGSGTYKNPSVFGNLTLHLISWGQPINQVYEGTVRLKNHTFNSVISNKNKSSSFTVSLRKSSDTVHFNQFLLKDSASQSALFTGKMDLHSRTLSGDVVIRELNTSKVSPLIPTLRLFSGNLNMDGKIRGTLKSPELQGKLWGGNLALKNKYQTNVGSIKSDLLLMKNYLAITNTSIAENYDGYFKFWNDQKKFELGANIQNGDPKVLFALMNVNQELFGELNGSLELKHRLKANVLNEEKAWIGKVDLELKNGRINQDHFESIHLDADFSDDRLVIHHFDILQKDGSFKVVGETSQKKIKNSLKIEASFDNFLLASSRIQGDIELSGKYFIQDGEWSQGKIKSQEFMVNEFGGGELEGTYQFKDRVLDLDRLSWSKFFKGEARLKFIRGSSPLIKGKWNSKERLIADWNKLFRVKDVPVQGKVALSGNIFGNLKQPEYFLTTQIKNVRLRTENEKSKSKLKFSGFSGEGEAELSNGIFKSLKINLKTTQGGDLNLLGQIHLKNQELRLESQFNNLESADVVGPIGWDVFKGKSKGQLTISGHWKNPTVTGRIVGSEGFLGNIALGSWEATGEFQKNKLLFTHLKLLGRRNSWRFSVLKDSWIRKTKEQKETEFSLNTDFANLKLGTVFFVGNGIATGSLIPGENQSKPELKLKAIIRDGSANNFEFEDIHLNTHFHDNLLSFLPLEEHLRPKHHDKDRTTIVHFDQLDGSIDLSDPNCTKFNKLKMIESGVELFYIDGFVCPEKPAFNMRGKELDASLIAGILDSPLELRGPVDFKVQGYSIDEIPSIQGNLFFRKGSVNQVPMDDLSASFEWKNGLLQFPRFRAIGKEYFEIETFGSFPLDWGTVKMKKPKIDFTSKILNSDLAFLNFFSETEIKNAKGKLTGEITIRGDPSDPEVEGEVTIKNGEGDYKYFGKKLKNLDFEARIRSNRVVIRKGEFKVGKGQVKMSGLSHLSLEDGDALLDEYHVQFETVNGKGIPILVPELPSVQQKLGIPSAPSKGSPTFSILLSGGISRPEISGWLQLEETLFSYPPPETNQRSRTWLDRVQWDLEIRTGKKTIFQNEFAYAKIEGNMKFNGTIDELKVKGKMKSDEGTISLYGAKFDLKEALMEVTEPPKIPFINRDKKSKLDTDYIVYLQFNAEQTTLINDPQGGKISDTITLRLERTPLTGEFDSKKVTFRSSQNPNLASEKVATRAGLGVDLEGLTPEERNVQLRQGIARLLDAQLASPLARSILQRTGLVDRIEFSQDQERGRSEELRGEGSSAIDPLIGQSVLFERTIGSKLGIGYQATFDRIQDRADMIHQLQLRYPFFRGFYLYGSAELDSRENLGREPERRGGIQTTIRFDPSEWFKKSDKKKKKKK